MKKTSIILIVLFILGSSFNQRISVDTNAKLKAVFIYNFTKYIEWPKTYQEGYFVLGVVGETPLFSELTKMAQTKKIGTQSILVKKFSEIADIDKCHLLYITDDKSIEINAILKKTKSTSTLIITEQEGLVDKGAGINFVIRENKQKFEMNKRNIEIQKLKVSSNLEALAVTVK
ncbi:MAG: hypothetical protein COW67_04635 [Flavobacteriales bacterium CG18_big_fil_WC_8_21_14_2_50_32_9]|nr:YfiR family protein [Flavobacteriales bacterium]PIQ16129.1 MAG: hypothetical protein COW67_04635 [Flavobacteriales bacterium CG18_big_fil_WC_8_21_14_2_50_32_9]PJC63103.1 MAG: DUF4154 domain-containing protein [Flavobacteriales bacterium CG_4_9_14_0_2_um_filter_32_27]